jgi:hypothetical protein
MIDISGRGILKEIIENDCVKLQAVSKTLEQISSVNTLQESRGKLSGAQSLEIIFLLILSAKYIQQ